MSGELMLRSRTPRRGAHAAAALAIVAALATTGGCGSDGSSPPGAAPRDTVIVAVASAPASAFVGGMLTLSPAVRVTDGDGRPMADVTVRFDVTAGGGSVTPADARTNAQGNASVQLWTLGAVPGPNVLRVSVGGRAVTFNTAAVERPPAAWEWRAVATSLGDKQVAGLMIDPEDDARWYASSIERGLYVTEDAGATWRHALEGAGVNKYGVAIDRADPRRVFAAVGPVLWASEDRGATWQRRFTFGQWVRSLTVSRDGTLYVAPQWGATDVPGIYASTDSGRTFAHHSFGIAQGTQILTWHLFEHPKTGALYAANEIANHPAPYRAPMFRSRDGGETWEDVTGALPWHVTEMAVDTTAGRLYALTEGAGLWVSTDDGTTWTRAAPQFGAAVLVDPRRAGWVFVTHFRYQTWPGGAYLSTSHGAAPVPIGLAGLGVATLAMDRAGTRLYAVVYGTGIFTALIGSSAP